MPHKSPADRRRYARDYHRANRKARKVNKRKSALRAKERDPEEVRRKWREAKAATRAAAALKALDDIRGTPKAVKAPGGYSGVLRPNGF